MKLQNFETLKHIWGNCLFAAEAIGKKMPNQKSKIISENLLQ